MVSEAIQLEVCGIHQEKSKMSMKVFQKSSKPLPRFQQGRCPAKEAVGGSVAWQREAEWTVASEAGGVTLPPQRAWRAERQAKESWLLET